MAKGLRRRYGLARPHFLTCGCYRRYFFCILGSRRERVRTRAERSGQAERVAQMQDRTKSKARKLLFRGAVAAGIVIFAGLVAAMGGCGSSKPAEQAAPPQSAEQQQPAGPQRYKLTGRVVSVEAPKQQVTVDAGDIPGFMAAMTMGYSVHDANSLAQLSPEDQITADVVVNGSDVYLENIKITKKAGKSTAPAAPVQPAK